MAHPLPSPRPPVADLLAETENRPTKHHPARHHSTRTHPVEHHQSVPALNPETANVQDFITAAQAAIEAGHNSDAIELIDAAQTRILSRSVVIGTTHVPLD